MKTLPLYTDSIPKAPISAQDLRKSFERPETRRSNGDFKVGQLVSVGKDTRAVIVRLEAGNTGKTVPADDSPSVEAVDW